MSNNYSVQYDDIPLMVSKIAELAARVQELELLYQLAQGRIALGDKKISRLIEAGDKMAKHSYPMTDSAHSETGTYCVYCHKSYKFDHEDYCPVTLWNKEAHE